MKEVSVYNPEILKGLPVSRFREEQTWSSNLTGFYVAIGTTPSFDIAEVDGPVDFHIEHWIKLRLPYMLQQREVIVPIHLSIRVKIARREVVDRASVYRTCSLGDQ